jgi:large subunit ribosomal protein L31e
LSQEAERVYTINLGKVWLSPNNQRAKRAINMIREFATHHMKTEQIKIDQDLSQAVWKRGIRSPPRKIRVKMAKTDDGYVLVSPYEEETKLVDEKPKAKDKRAEKELEEKIEEKIEEKEGTEEAQELKKEILEPKETSEKPKKGKLEEKETKQKPKEAKPKKEEPMQKKSEQKETKKESKGKKSEKKPTKKSK